MAKISQLLKKVKYFYSYFAVEFILAIIMASAVGGNLVLQANAKQAQKENGSLYFVYLKDHPSANPKLVDAFETVSVALNQTGNLIKQVLAASVQNNDVPVSGTAQQSAPFPSLSGSALIKANPAGSETFGPNRDIQVYTVKSNDTLSDIADNYGVSISTIIWENNMTANDLIRPGQELRILPTDGVKHTIKSGETLEAIAKKYNIDLETILEYNNIEFPDLIQPGDELIIPNGVKATPATPQRQQYLADLKKNDYKQVQVPADYQGGGSNFTWPLPGASRLSQKFSRLHPAIDLPCKNCNVVSAADGIVEIAGWQKGYGYTIVINHGSGYKTRYGHASNLLVSAGQKVTKGQIIMISGSTGRSTGPHLHFEILKNGTKLNPLSLVSSK